ncbi:immunity 49 family protein [Corallococcus sp. M34]|uniref:immunity 49 family protein n=1 Tax=Citreicoccus inhibens TaxID=2849499 RepID=UPI001C24D75F|nr:immunity 49 family protein [Citreicoccus inhibens]MBU8900169.1 immunity 49 family protein [Citreicoccus inhibens]
MACYTGDVPRPVWQGDLERFALLTAENPDPHLDVCKGLLEGNQSLFDEGLKALCAQKLEATAKALRAETLNPDEAATLAHVSTEILATVELAERVGLRVASDYPLAPGVARRFHRRAFPAAESWQAPEPFRSLPKPRP